MWGGDPVHPSEDAYGVIARAIEDHLSNPEARYTNTPKTTAEPPFKRPRVDLAASGQDWVSGCSATLRRRDTVSGRGGGGYLQRPLCSGVPHSGAVAMDVDAANLTSKPST
jgi:hypothetical protein